MKDKKKLLLIGGLILVLVLVVVLYLVFSNTDKNNYSNNDGTGDKGNKIVAPANNTEELVKEMEAIKIETVTEDEIVFSNNIKLEENQKVAVWIYSEPKFLGYFDVLVENGVKKIVGLKEAIEKITIEDGEHNIAITTETGKPLGYVGVRIENNGTLTESVVDELVEEEAEEVKEEEPTKPKEEPVKPTEKPVKPEEEKTTTKNITEIETIKYSSTKQNEVNMKKGATAVVQSGSNGTKEITYEVTYDSKGKELSRKKISEKITKEAVNEIIKVGTSDFNINTDKTGGVVFGFACPESKTYIASYDGLLYCNDEKYEDLEQFGAFIIEDMTVVTSIGNAKLPKVIMTTPVNDYVVSGTYNGQKYYFDGRLGDSETGTLTLEACNNYGLSCGAW